MASRFKYALREAYGLLADIYITEEAALYANNKNNHGGWVSARKFEITHKHVESELVTSFILTPVDGKAVIAHKLGQYIGIKVKPQSAEYEAIRQYSLSQKSNAKNYRISVKKECQPKPGVVSNYLHSLGQGARVELYPPAGDFILKNEATPMVFISAGVGQTPMMAMLQTLLSDNSHQAISYLHACENSREFSFKEYLAQQTAMHPQLKTFTWFNQGGEECDFTGLMDLSVLEVSLPISEGVFYLCGPASFMAYVKGQLLDLGVQSSNIHYEIFGPHQAL
ncbi:FAD-binding oxidoreductase [Pseudoalteromonas sp.]|uniref:FAD-binding oxidoreductase n=1 Tax=Pseudoalteromonas sp. TaxID=53249 RepID=UPI002604B0CF|nr:FAD-binding oxidoreductase [Pseudoalteromonas sp.]